MDEAKEDAEKKRTGLMQRMEQNEQEIAKRKKEGTSYVKRSFEISSERSRNGCD
jgi:hypothetical protein